MSESFAAELEQELQPYWQKIMQCRLYKALMNEPTLPIELLQLYLIESYHYVKHNAQHQAMAVWQVDVRNRSFMRAALKHAIEEVDHDQLALRDLEKTGLDRLEIERSVPLPETLGFTGFLYYWVTRENPIGRLGYSLWAESTQHIAGSIVSNIKEKFGITDDKALSFFVAHAILDERHGVEAKESIDRYAVTPEDQEAVRTVAHTTFKLFLILVEAIYDRYLEVLEGAPVVREPKVQRAELAGARL